MIEQALAFFGFAEWVVFTFLLVGFSFNLLGVIGLFRFPDPYTRLHASTKCTTFGSLLMGFGVIIFYLFSFPLVSSSQFMTEQMIYMVSHVLFALAVLLVASATESHAIAKSAYDNGLKPIGKEVSE